MQTDLSVWNQYQEGEVRLHDLFQFKTLQLRLQGKLWEHSVTKLNVYNGAFFMTFSGLRGFGLIPLWLKEKQFKMVTSHQTDGGWQGFAHCLNSRRHYHKSKYKQYKQRICLSTGTGQMITITTTYFIQYSESQIK